VLRTRSTTYPPVDMIWGRWRIHFRVCRERVEVMLLLNKIVLVLLIPALVLGGVLFAPCACADEVSGEACCGGDSSSCCSKDTPTQSCCTGAEDEAVTIGGGCCVGNCVCEVKSTSHSSSEEPHQAIVPAPEDTGAKLAYLAPLFPNVHFTRHFRDAWRAHSVLPPPGVPFYVLNCAFLN